MLSFSNKNFSITTLWKIKILMTKSSTSENYKIIFKINVIGT